MKEIFETDLYIIKEQLLSIGEDLVQTNRLLLGALKDCDTQKFSTTKLHGESLTCKTDVIDNNIINFLALYNPKSKDLKELVSYLKITNELSRIFTITKGLINNFIDICNNINIASIREYSVPMQVSTLKALEISINMLSIISLGDKDELDELYHDVLIEESKTHDLYEVVERSLSIENMSKNNFNEFHKILKALRKSSKIASRALSIATLAIYSGE